MFQLFKNLSFVKKYKKRKLEIKTKTIKDKDKVFRNIYVAMSVNTIAATYCTSKISYYALFNDV